MPRARRTPVPARAGRLRVGRALRGVVLAVLASVASGCMALAPQLPPTDFGALETLSDRGARERAYEANAITTYEEPQGRRYTKGTNPRATKRSWQSLDAILRSDATTSAAIPRRPLRLARLFMALTATAAILTVAGIAASAREGLDLKEIDGAGAVLLGGGIATVGFGITSGVFYGRTKGGYERAVELYNDRLALRLGLRRPDGSYIPAQGVLVDEEGFILLDEQERVLEGPEPPPPSTEPPALPPATPPATPPTPPASTTPLEAAPPAQPPPAEPEPIRVRPTKPEPEVPLPPGGLSLRPRRAGRI